MSCQVRSDIEAAIITFTMSIRRCRSSVIIELQEIVLQVALCGRQIGQFECDNTDSIWHSTKIVNRKIS